MNHLALGLVLFVLVVAGIIAISVAQASDSKHLVDAVNDIRLCMVSGESSEAFTDERE